MRLVACPTLFQTIRLEPNELGIVLGDARSGFWLISPEAIIDRLFLGLVSPPMCLDVAFNVGVVTVC